MTYMTLNKSWGSYAVSPDAPWRAGSGHETNFSSALSSGTAREFFLERKRELVSLGL